MKSTKYVLLAFVALTGFAYATDELVFITASDNAVTVIAKVAKNPRVVIRLT